MRTGPSILIRGIVVGLLALAASPMTLEGGAAAPAPAKPPRLILFLVVDQCRADYLLRFAPFLHHGFRRLLEEGVVFTDAHHDHAITKTAPGHTSLVTGTHPSRHGIISNRWYSPAAGKEVEAVEGDWEDATPGWLLVSSLGDWLQDAYPEARVYGASLKDRSAVLMVGRGGHGAYWYDDENGRFVSSDYYPNAAPGWLDDFNRAQWSDRYFGILWEALPETTRATAELDLREPDRGLFSRRFPHTIGRASTAPDKYFYEDLAAWTPFSDEILGEFARALIEGEQLGDDASPDLLALSFAALDKIGHRFGPDSPELLDTLQRTDRVLGELLSYVDRRLGLENVLVSLSSDHGVNPMRGTPVANGSVSRHLDTEGTLCLQTVERRLDLELGADRWFDYDLHLDRETIARRGLAYVEVEAAAQAELASCPGVRRVWRRSELTSERTAHGTVAARFAHSFHVERSPDFLIQLESHAIAWTDQETTHGSVYDYDSHVPWLVRLPSGSPAVVAERVHTVDVAPTLAELAHLTAPSDLDGRSRAHRILESTAPTREEGDLPP